MVIANNLGVERDRDRSTAWAVVQFLAFLSANVTALLDTLTSYDDDGMAGWNCSGSRKFICSEKAIKGGLVGFLFLLLIQNLVAVDATVNSMDNISTTLYLSIIFCSNSRASSNRERAFPSEFTVRLFFGVEGVSASFSSTALTCSSCRSSSSVISSAWLSRSCSASLRLTSGKTSYTVSLVILVLALQVRWLA